MFTPFKRKIGIVGLANAGKTVFLTSLLSHLCDHEPDKLPLTSQKKDEKAVVIRRFESLEMEDGLESFPFKEFRNALVKRRNWPAKTKDTSHFRCRFERSDWMAGLDLTFIDIPGERFGDAVMVGNDYAQWSEKLLKSLKEDPEYQTLAEPYFQVMEQDDISEDELLQAYKLTMAKFALSLRPLLSPSVFALDQDGVQYPRLSAEDVAKERLSGLTAETQFCPLPRSVREKMPELTEAFAERYRDYQTTVPLPLFRQLQGCHRLIVLVDVTDILATNVGAYNDAEAILEEVLRSCVKQRRGMWSKVGMWLASATLPDSWRPKGISRIAFVATKSDLVKFDEVDHIRSLLKQLIEKKIRDYDVNHEFFSCSAIQSTLFKDGKLLGHPLVDEAGEPNEIPTSDTRLMNLEPSEVPEEWPMSWKEGDFCFPEVYPKIPVLINKPPVQDGLNEILDFLLDETWTE